MMNVYPGITTSPLQNTRSVPKCHDSRVNSIPLVYSCHHLLLNCLISESELVGLVVNERCGRHLVQLSRQSCARSVSTWGTQHPLQHSVQVLLIVGREIHIRRVLDYQTRAIEMTYDEASILSSNGQNENLVFVSVVKFKESSSLRQLTGTMRCGSISGYFRRSFMMPRRLSSSPRSSPFLSLWLSR
jgi:hypothetical protein